MRKVQPIRDERVIDGMKEYFYIRSMRNYLFFCMGIYSGLRVSDLLELKAWQTKGTHISMVEQKNKHAKTFIIHPSIRGDLDEFTADMRPTDYLFASRQIKTISRMRNKPIDRTTAYRFLHEAAQEFRLKDIGVHSLRKTWAYRLYMDNPENLALLMDMFGHSDPRETLDYIGLTQDMMDKAILNLR
ncbi:tyrosine-type recombinase/integrase [Paenibacillus sp. FSL H8-0317]|uniref:tyrosine-type recombinase/integrase n=1 Tax=Paenibacillus sp. FSL H8-0317 TaxID=2921385 RepID=UPI003246593A